MGVFDNIVSQYIDSHGKCRILNYSNSLSLIISPIAPLDVYQVSMEESLSSNPSTQYAVEYAMNNEFGEIVEQVRLGDTQSIKGFWIKTKEFKFAYIPVSRTDGYNQYIEGVDASHPSIVEPIVFNKGSKLDTMKSNKLIALYLKEYALYAFAQNKGKLSETDFVVNPDHIYNTDELLKSMKISDNTIYKNKRLFVKNPETIERLIKYVNIRQMNDSFIIYNYQNLKSIDIRRYFKPGQFKTDKDEAIISGKEQLIYWKNNIQTSDREVVNIIDSKKTPYYYRSFNVNDGNIVIIQHVKGDTIESARAVSDHWKTYGVNMGYEYRSKEKSKYKTIVYDIQNDSIEGLDEDNGDDTIKVIRFKDQGYASILTL